MFTKTALQLLAIITLMTEEATAAGVRDLVSRKPTNLVQLHSRLKVATKVENARVRAKNINKKNKKKTNVASASEDEEDDYGEEEEELSE